MIEFMFVIFGLFSVAMVILAVMLAIEILSTGKDKK